MKFTLLFHLEPNYYSCMFLTRDKNKDLLRYLWQYLSIPVLSPCLMLVVVSPYLCYQNPLSFTQQCKNVCSPGKNIFLIFYVKQKKCHNAFLAVLLLTQFGTKFSFGKFYNFKYLFLT